METENLISIETISTHYNVELAFIFSLNDFGLIEIITHQDVQFVQRERLSDIEKLVRMHYELGINLEGIDAISHLLSRISSMQNELNLLRNKVNNTRN